MLIIDALYVIGAIIIGLVIGYFLRRYIGEGKIGGAEEFARKILEDAEREARDRRNEVQNHEKRVLNKEENLDKKAENLEKKEEKLTKLKNQVVKKETEINNLYDEQVSKLENISGLTRDEAKQVIFDDLEKEVSRESAIMIKEMKTEARENAEKESKEIISRAIQRYAADHVAETTVTVVSLPNDEMKGRIIGREGRNIRTLETLTGIDLIIDDTPEAVVLSGFDPIRREIARIALEKLIIDGRIHPARIEEMVGKAKKEVDGIIKEVGEQAAFDTAVHGIHPEIIKLLGRLKYRTSYGQNVLNHSIEVAHLAAIMATELGANVKIAKRAGLLHDIGKAVDHEIEGPHVDIGVDLAVKYNESKEVVHGIAAHHGDLEATTIEAVLVQAADAISAARPGARRESLENYVKRLETLEDIANSIEGVEKSFAIQAGREVRIMVKPEEVDETETINTARKIVKKIENQLDYPGQIKINVIRETRAIEYAK